MKDLMGLMKQAKEMQSKMEAAQANVATLSVTGQAGAGMVSVTLSGEFNMSGLTIDPKLLSGEEPEIVEDLIVAAYQDAKVKLNQAQAAAMKDAMGDIPLPPGMKSPF